MRISVAGVTDPRGSAERAELNRPTEARPGLPGGRLQQLQQAGRNGLQLVRSSLAALVALLLFAAPGFRREQGEDHRRFGRTSRPTRGPSERDDAGVAKFGAWTPVYVSLEVLQGISEPAELLIETPDADELNTVLAIPIDLTGVAPGSKVFARNAKQWVTCVRPA